MITNIKFFLVIFLISGLSFAQTKITLKDAIQLALQKNTILNQAENNILSQESGVTAAYGNFMPSLSGFASWGWDRNEQAGSIRYINGIPFNIPKITSETRSYIASVNSDITLFDGLSNIANLSAANNNLNSTRLYVEFLKQQTVINTITRYYNLMTQIALLKVREENVKKQEINFKTIEEKNRLGAATLADLYQQQVELGNAELQVINQNLEVQKAKNNLLIFLGLDVTGNYTFETDFTLREESILTTDLESDYKNIQERISDAYNNRLDYKSKLYELEGSIDQITMARSGHFPRLTGSLGFSSYSNKFDELFKSKTYSVGLNLNIPIFSGFSVSNRVQIAEVQSMNKELEVRELERKIKQEINESYLSLIAAKKSLSVSEKNVKAAEERLKIEQERYNLGSGKLLDLLIANSSYITAQTDYVNAQYSYIIISDQIKYYLGILDINKYE
ncbi:Outer membrane protein TolC [Ignavibacterium album JCM 16511]|uniref:Outer membrane protein TolC n=1 Tax=Ignavibacterium album (strain DSM 19864 / JCM 16511 / NBRC 101810 / Mat9-16) TaxID=945713 RepID=I0AKA1_IGNAJ|nr:TolC family protein [Ignavibacterium album]AFH49408.1 Outer membrane protein TolC [Ignavibacterium album JCM 16511]